MNNDLLILYGSMTGNAEDCAKRTAKKAAELGVPHRLINMNDFNAADLVHETTVFVLVSTWGDGEPPDDALSFYAKLEKVEPGSLCELTYAVFGLGDSNYEIFCGCGKRTEQLFQVGGAKALVERVDADVDFEEPFTHWTEKVFAALPALR